MTFSGRAAFFMCEYSRAKITIEVATDPDKKVVTANGQTTTTYPTDGAVTYKWTATSSVAGGATGTFANDTVASTTWTAPTTVGIYTLKCALDDPWTGTQTGVVLPETGSKNDKAADGSVPVVREVKVYVTKVKFTEDTSQKYGFDDRQFIGAINLVPYKSVGFGKIDTAIANVEPAAAAAGIVFNSSQPNYMQLSPEPLPGTTSPQTITIKGFDKTYGLTEFPYVRARPIDKTNDIPSYLNVAVYKPRTMKLGLAVVHRKSDDVQKIPFGGGDTTKPNQVCIEPSADGALDTNPNKKLDGTLSGDDTINGSNITTGPDGICQSTASYNGVRVDKNDVLLAMNFVYKQAVLDWDVEDIPGQVVDFDQGAKDKMIDIGVGTIKPWWDTAEQRAVRNAFSTASKGFHKVVFIVPNPTMSYGGLSSLNQPYGFVFPTYTGTLSRAFVVHEVGHALGLPHTEDFDEQGQLPDPPKDPFNLMYPIVTGHGLLRKYQWDIVSPSADPTTIP